MKGVQCYELFGGIALKNHTHKKSHIFIFMLQLGNVVKQGHILLL